MPSTVTIPTSSVIPGQLITAALWNAEFTNIFNALDFSGLGDYSDTDPEMQTQTDPYPGSVISRPTSGAGELERLRFSHAEIKGTTYWYEDAPISLTTLLTHTHSGGTGGSQIPTDGIADGAVTNVKIASGTIARDRMASGVVFEAGVVAPFFQASAPLGWTQVVTQNDKALRVVSGTGGGTGGTNAMSAGLSHSHTVNSHTHDLGNHTHTGPSHTHTVPRDGWGVASSATTGRIATIDGGAGAGNSAANDNTSGAGGTGATSGPSTNTSGAASPGTNTQSPTFQYIDVIICSRD